MSKQKLNCKPCMKGNCAECESIDCLCLESHNKDELIKSFTETARSILPGSPEELKQILKDNPETEEESKEKKSLAQKIYKFAKMQIDEIVISKTDSAMVYGIIQINNHKETILLGSYESIQWLKALYFKEDSDFHSDDIYKKVLSMITAQVQQHGDAQRVDVYNRIAMTNDAIYYDLCSPKWEAIKITKHGYEIISLNENTPIFARKQQQSEQIRPKKGPENVLDSLIKLLRIQPNDAQIFKIHIITMLLERYPIPIMVIHGEHGSAKSTISKSIARIIDPSGMNISSIPKNPADLALYFQNRFVSNFDNVSEINQEISDMMCRAITGEGFVKRKLYTDDNEIIWNYKRKIILNGIAPSLEFPDFKERSIFYETTQVREDERMSEEEFQARFEVLLPYVLHEVFTLLADVLLMYKRVKKEISTKFRMADFTIFGECISRMMKNQDMLFLKSYRDKLDIDSMKMVNSYPIVKIIVELMKDISHLEDSIEEFYKKIEIIAGEKNVDTTKKEVRFPKAPNRLSTQINQLKSTFRKYDLEIQIKPYNSRDGKYTRGQSIIYIVKLDVGQKTLND